MINTYLTSGWRNLVKNKVYSALNISGLSLGLTCSLLTGLWVIDEYSMDALHENGDRIFIVTSKEYSGGEITYGGYDTPALLGEELPRILPEVEYACSFSGVSWNTFKVGDKIMKVPGSFAGVDFLRIFSYPLVTGSRESALKAPESIIISRSMAVSLFGSPELAIDQSVLFDNYKDLKVTAVFEDMADNVTDKVQFVTTWEFWKEREGEWVKDWGNSGPSTVALLRANVDVTSVLPKIRHFIKAYDANYSDTERLELGLQLYRDKYLHSNFRNGEVSGGRIEYVRLFEAVAIFILLIACINFMNMSTARSVTRAKEIGVRKVIGAMRPVLIKQFMTEALMSTLIAVSIAVVLTSLLLPEFNLLTEKNIVFPFGKLRFWAAIGALTLITALLSGSYPALFLSAFKPIAAIRNNLKLSSSSVFFRKGLVVFQFALSVTFVVGMIVVTRQVDYIQSKDLGYEKENLVYVSSTGNVGRNFAAFKHELLQVPGVVNVTNMIARPIELENTTSSVIWEGKAPDQKPVFTQVAVGYDFASTMNANVIAGRDFSMKHADSSNYLINESALRIIGYKDPVGMPLTFWGKKGVIIGVVRDFHFESLHVPIKPLVIRLADHHFGWVCVRVDAKRTVEAIAQMEAVHKKFNPDFPFAHHFADEAYNSMYQSELVARKLSRYFAVLSIIISSLGLLGLVIFSAAQRTREVGIRKVLGASVGQIVALLSGDFMKLVLLSMLVSLPLAYYMMDEWLRGFEYRIGIEWWMLAAAGTGAIVVALVTLSFHAIKAAMANPVNSLRSE